MRETFDGGMRLSSRPWVARQESHAVTELAEVTGQETRPGGDSAGWSFDGGSGRASGKLW